MGLILVFDKAFNACRIKVSLWDRFKAPPTATQGSLTDALTATTTASGLQNLSNCACVVETGVLMKTLHISEDIIPIGKFKARAAQVLRQLKDDQRPIIITQNGSPAAVLLTPEEFDRLVECEAKAMAAENP